MTYHVFRSFIWRFLFGSALILGAVYVVNYIVDPFEYNDSDLVELDRKQISNVIQRRVYKMSRFRHFNGDTVLFGDSTINQFPPESFADKGGNIPFNFGVGGSNLYEMLDVINYALNNKSGIKRVYLGVPFGDFDDVENMSTFVANADVTRNTFTINLSYVSARASLENLVYRASGYQMTTERPPMEPDLFWAASITSAQTQLERRIGASKIKHRLLQTVCALKDRGIDVTIVVPPVHADIRKVWFTQVPREYAAYKAWLPVLGTVIDLDVDGPFVRNRSNFEDPAHIAHRLRYDVGRSIFKQDTAVLTVYHGEPQCGLPEDNPVVTARKINADAS